MYSGGQEKFNLEPEILPVEPEISLPQNDAIYEEILEVLRKEESLPEPEQNYSNIDGVKFFGNLADGFKRIYGATKFVINKKDSANLSIVVKQAIQGQKTDDSSVERISSVKRFWGAYLLSLDKNKRAEILGKEGYLVVGRDWNVYIVPKSQKDALYGEPIRYKLSA
jgi:hypothetical protein